MIPRIFPTAKSVALRPTDLPPVFEVITDRPMYFVVEVAIDDSLFDIKNLHRRNPPSGKPNFFNSFQGLPTLGIPGKALKALPNRRMRLPLPPSLWTHFKKYERIYYRVIVAERIRGGKLAGRIFYSTEDKDYQNAPYVHVLLPSIRPYYHRSSKPTTRRRTPWLMVYNNKLIEGRRSHPPKNMDSSKPKVLRGVNFSGLQYRQHNWGTPEGKSSRRWWQAAGITQARIQEIGSWGANIIRLPLNQDWVLNGVARKSGVEYLKDIDQIIDWAATAGLYTLLDLQVLDTHGGGAPVPPMPNNLSLVFWKILASRYRSDSAVLYDLCNEPHKPNRTEMRTYKGYKPPKDEGWINLWHDWVRELEGVIHSAHWNALLFVSGIGGPCWAASLRKMPVPVPPYRVKTPNFIPNAVYSSHIYYHLKDDGDGVDDSPGNKIGTAKSEHWAYWFGFDKLRKNHPIFLGEWGGEPIDFWTKFKHLSKEDQRKKFALLPASEQGKVMSKMLDWGKKLEKYLRDLHKTDERSHFQGLVGWTAWSWGDHPYLVKRQKASGRKDRPFVTKTVSGKVVHEPTKFGELVKNALGSP